MSHDSDTAKMGRAMTEDRQRRHRKWKEDHIAFLRSQFGEFPFTETVNGETLFYRLAGFPRVDFYPSTGRWTNVETGKVMRGGPRSFLMWFRRQQKKVAP